MSLRAKRAGNLGLGLRDSKESGQAFTEYLILMAMTVSLYLLMVQGLQKMRLEEKLALLFQKYYAVVYQYGHPKVKGFEEGGPTYHPRVLGGDNFRIFLNPIPQ